MHVKNSFEPPLLVAWVFTALNLLNLLMWIAGLHISIGFYAAALLTTLVYGLLQRKAKLLIVCGVLGIFTLITLNDPVSAWDARSIWFFHAKRIYLSHSLYAPLDGYASWTHNDYPVLVPALAASVAATVGYWNEVLPRIAELLALAPALFMGAYLFRAVGSFCLWLSLVLVVCWGEILGGYMDSLIAVYFSLALVVMSEIYKGRIQSPALSGSKAPTLWGLMLAVCLVNLMLLKNEGLVLSGIVVACLLPVLLKDHRLLALCMLPFAFFAAVWKLPVMLAGVSTDLIRQGGLWQRGVARASSQVDLSLIFGHLGEAVFWYAIALASLAVFAIFKRRHFAYLLPPILAIVGYLLVLLAVYLTTYQPLEWHLLTSATRVVLAINLASGTLFLYALGDIKDQVRHGRIWGIPER